MTNQATDQRRNVLPLRVEWWLPKLDTPSHRAIRRNAVFAENEAICHFSVMFASSFTTITYPLFSAHYIWLRFAEIHVFASPSPPTETPAFFTCQRTGSTIPIQRTVSSKIIY
jgi:hypothetical protein